MNQTPIQVVDLGPVKGRALITTRKIEIDEVIFKERPLICCQLSWNRLNGHRCCDYCLKPLENPTDNARRLTGQNSLVLPAVAGVAPPDSPIPSVYCPTCRTEFCSNECFQASQSEYHTFICCENANNPFNALEEYWRSCHPMPETGTVMLLVRIAAAYLAAHALKSERAQHIVTALSRFVSSPVVEIPNEVGASSSDGSSSSATLAHRLMGPNFSGDLLNLHGLFKQCVAEMIRRTGAPGEFDAICQQIGLTNLLSDYGFCSAICLLGRNGQGIGCSSLGAWGRTAESVVNERGNPEECEQFSDFLDKLYITLDETVGENLNVEGVGLYEQQSLINHSCEPNTAVVFESGNNELSLIAARDIDEPGTELTICYLDEYMQLRHAHSRRKYLREHYLFNCNCQYCQEEMADPDYESVSTPRSEGSSECEMEMD